MQIGFPSGFLWGASLSSYQCEGNNLNSDWYLWEKEKGLEPCGLACNHYHLFDQDFQSARELNLNSLRLSLEWARICPQKSIFSDQEISHYVSVIDTLGKYNLKPVITLHHFTNPIWFSQEGGWSNQKNIDYFLNYLQKVVKQLKDKVEIWIIFNEPLVYIYQGFIAGCWPPGKACLKEAKKVLANILDAYCLGYEEIKKIYASKPVLVSFSKNMRVFSASPGLGFFLNSLPACLRNRYFNWQVLAYLAGKNKLDFIGLNYYSKEYTKFKGLLGEESHKFYKERKNYLDWNVYPEGLSELLLRLKQFKLPVIITENGTAEAEDWLYGDFLVKHLREVARSLSQGIDIRGYFWWSLMDNFEWDKGFKPRFGLLKVDYQNFARTPREFAAAYAQLCRKNQLEI